MVAKVDDGAALARYFKECKWIFVLDRTLYERYLTELAQLVTVDNL